MAAYYNEHDKFAAAWLRELIKARVIADGEVDERDIQLVRPEDLRDFVQCHFFAGIGVWSYALRSAGWPDSKRVWTGSCPCQPFSVSGKRAGASDGRHLWPVWFPLIRESRPELVFGEQVASDDGLAWLDLVHADLEGQGYTVGAVDTCAAGVGAPHIRQRLYFCADAARSGSGAGLRDCESRELGRIQSANCGGIGDRRDTEQQGLERLAGDEREWRGPGWLDPVTARSVAAAGATRGFWRDCDWWYGRDGKFRPIEPGLFPLGLMGLPSVWDDCAATATPSTPNKRKPSSRPTATSKAGR